MSGLNQPRPPSLRIPSGYLATYRPDPSAGAVCTSATTLTSRSTQTQKACRFLQPGTSGRVVTLSCHHRRFWPGPPPEPGFAKKPSSRGIPRARDGLTTSPPSDGYPVFSDVKDAVAVPFIFSLYRILFWFQRTCDTFGERLALFVSGLPSPASFASKSTWKRRGPIAVEPLWQQSFVAIPPMPPSIKTSSDLVVLVRVRRERERLQIYDVSMYGARRLNSTLRDASSDDGP